MIKTLEAEVFAILEALRMFIQVHQTKLIVESDSSNRLMLWLGFRLRMGVLGSINFCLTRSRLFLLWYMWSLCSANAMADVFAKQGVDRLYPLFFIYSFWCDQYSSCTAFFWIFQVLSGWLVIAFLMNIVSLPIKKIEQCKKHFQKIKNKKYRAGQIVCIKVYFTRENEDVMLPARLV